MQPILIILIAPLVDLLRHGRPPYRRQLEKVPGQFRADTAVTKSEFARSEATAHINLEIDLGCEHGHLVNDLGRRREKGAENVVRKIGGRPPSALVGAAGMGVAAGSMRNPGSFHDDLQGDVLG